MYPTILPYVLAWLSLVSAVKSEPVTLEALIEEALGTNPSINAVEKRVETARARVPQAGAPPDPILRIDFVNLPGGSIDFGRTPMSGKQISLSQSLPYPGTLAAKGDAARQGVLALESQLLDARDHLRHQVKETYYDLVFHDQSIRITRENVRLFELIADRALSRYEAGSGRQHDVLQARVALSLLKNRVTGFEAARRVDEVKMNGLLGRSADTGIEVESSVHVHSVAVSAQALTRVAEKDSKILRELTHQSRAWTAWETAAKKSGRPGFTLNLSYRQRQFVAGDPVSGDDFFSAGLGINLPIFRGRKQLAKAAEARANVAWLEARMVEERRRIETDIQRIVVELRLHAKEQDLFTNEILPQTEQALRSARSAYEGDLVNFSTLLNAQSAWLEAELMRFHHGIAHAKLLAELEAIVGVSLEDQTGQPGRTGAHP